MIKSIQHFEEKSIHKFEKLEDEFIKHPTQLAEYVMGITKELYELGLQMIKESLEEMDQMLQESQVRLRDWVIESHTEKSLITSLGTVRFQKTLFQHRKTGKREYLLDRILGLQRGERMSEDALARLLKEAVQTSYERGGEAVSLTTSVSRATVKNKIHSLEIPKETEALKKKKEVEYLYIDADEDHVALQFQEKKGDLRKEKGKRKNNCLLTKLVYVYEGIEREWEKSERKRLRNPYYFCGVNRGEGNKQFWQEIYQYLDRTYDLEKVKKIYVNSDGGNWILAGMRQIKGLCHVLDGFHMEKSIGKLARAKGMKKEELREQLKKEKKEEWKRLLEEFWEEEGAKYLYRNFSAIKRRLQEGNGVIGSTTESHVSHVLSARMSSRPMGWSRKGARKMAELRAYDLNGGTMLALVRYQKQNVVEEQKETYEVLSSVQILQSEKKRHGILGKYMECIRHDFSLQKKKQLYFQGHIWGL